MNFTQRQRQNDRRRSGLRHRNISGELPYYLQQRHSSDYGDCGFEIGEDYVYAGDGQDPINKIEAVDLDVINSPDG